MPRNIKWRKNGYRVVFQWFSISSNSTYIYMNVCIMYMYGCVCVCVSGLDVKSACYEQSDCILTVHKFLSSSLRPYLFCLVQFYISKNLHIRPWWLWFARTSVLRFLYFSFLFISKCLTFGKSPAKFFLRTSNFPNSFSSSERNISVDFPQRTRRYIIIRIILISEVELLVLIKRLNPKKFPLNCILLQELFIRLCH